MSDSFQFTEEPPASETTAVEQPSPLDEGEQAFEATADSVASEAAADASALQRTAALAAIQASRDLPPGVRQRLASLVEQAASLNSDGDPLLPTRQVLDLLAQGLPQVLRRETTSAVSQPAHPSGDAFFQLHSDELSDHQAEQIARTQLQRVGLLHTA